MPLLRVHRAFPELDGFGDAVRAKFVRRAWATAGRSRWIVRSLSIALPVIAGTLCWRYGEPRWLVNRLPRPDVLRTLREVLTGVLGVGVSLIVALLVRDWWLRRRVREVLEGSRCPRCRYLLLGLRADEGRVRCPECGLLHEFTAEEVLLSSELEEAGDKPSPVSPPGPATPSDR